MFKLEKPLAMAPKGQAIRKDPNYFSGTATNGRWKPLDQNQQEMYGLTFRENGTKDQDVPKQQESHSHGVSRNIKYRK